MVRRADDHGASVLRSGSIDGKIIDRHTERVLPTWQRHPSILSWRERLLRLYLVPIPTRDWLSDRVHDGLGPGCMAGHLGERQRSRDSPIRFHVKPHKGKRTRTGRLGSIL